MSVLSERMLRKDGYRYVSVTTRHEVFHYDDVRRAVAEAYPLLVALNGPGTPLFAMHKYVFTGRLRAWLGVDPTTCLARYTAEILPEEFQQLLDEVSLVMGAKAGEALLDVYKHFIAHIRRGLTCFMQLWGIPADAHDEATRLERLTDLLVCYAAAWYDAKRKEGACKDLEQWYAAYARWWQQSTQVTRREEK